MGNIINISDKDGNSIGQASHGLSCAAYVNDICKQYNPDFTLWSNPNTLNERLEEIYKVCSKEDELILLLFINDESHFEESHIPSFEKAIAKLKGSDKVQESIKKHLQGYLSVLKEQKYIKTKYIGVTSAMTVSNA